MLAAFYLRLLIHKSLFNLQQINVCVFHVHRNKPKERFQLSDKKRGLEMREILALLIAINGASSTLEIFQVQNFSLYNINIKRRRLRLAHHIYCVLRLDLLSFWSMVHIIRGLLQSEFSHCILIISIGFFHENL